MQRLLPQAADTCTSVSLWPLCPTRCTVRTGSLLTVATNYSAVLQTLADISFESKDDTGAKAGGLLRRIESFDTLFGVHLALMVFEPAEGCSRAIQAKDISATEAKKSAVVTVNLLQNLREDTKFDELYEKCLQEAASLGVDTPSLGRRTCLRK